MGQNLLTIQTARSHSDTPHSVGLLWTSDQPDAETSTWQHSQDIHIHNYGGIRTHNPSKRAAADRAAAGIGLINKHLGITCKTGCFCNGRLRSVGYSWNSSCLYCNNIPILKRLGQHNSTIEWRSHLDSNRGTTRDGTTKGQSVYFTS
jgi:hypothetical protein